MKRGYRKNWRLIQKLNKALAKGANVTANWIQSVVVIAKKEWKVNDLKEFSEHLKTLLKKRGFEFLDDIECFLTNCWRCVTC